MTVLAPSPQILRRFGFILIAMSGAGFMLLSPSPWLLWFWGLEGFGLGLALLWPTLFYWPFVILSWFARKVAPIVEFILMVVLYFFLLTPYGLVRRIGRDPLALREKPDGRSYRVVSDQREPNHLTKPY